MTNAQVHAAARKAVGENASYRIEEHLSSRREAGLSEAQVEGVVYNAIRYCMQAMPEGGPITVGTFDSWSANAIKGAFGQIPAGDYVRITVANEGGTLSNEQFAGLFSTDNSLEALAACAKWNGVRLNVRSRDGFQAIDMYVLPR